MIGEPEPSRGQSGAAPTERRGCSRLVPPGPCGTQGREPRSDSSGREVAAIPSRGRHAPSYECPGARYRGQTAARTEKARPPRAHDASAASRTSSNETQTPKLIAESTPATHPLPSLTTTFATQSPKSDNQPHRNIDPSRGRANASHSLALLVVRSIVPAIRARLAGGRAGSADAVAR